MEPAHFAVRVLRSVREYGFLNHLLVQELDNEVLEDQLLHSQRMKVFASTACSVKSSNHFGRSRNGFPRAEPDEGDSPGERVEPGLVALFVRPRTTLDTWLSVLQCVCVFAMFDEIRLFTFNPRIQTPMIFAEFRWRQDSRGAALSKTNPNLGRTLLLLRSRHAVMTVVGRHDARMVSSSAEFKSFLVSTCIAAPKSTTNILSSVSVQMWTAPAPTQRRCEEPMLLCEPIVLASLLESV